MEGSVVLVAKMVRVRLPLEDACAVFDADEQLVSVTVAELEAVAVADTEKVAVEDAEPE